MNGVRVFTRAIRAESALRDQAGLPARWPLWDTTCLLPSHESQRLPPPPSFTVPSTSADGCQNRACSPLLGDCREVRVKTLSELVVVCQLRVKFSRLGSVFHGLPLTDSHNSYFTVNTVGLWLHSSGNVLHKKEVNPHVGTRPGLGTLTLFELQHSGGL